MELRNLQVEVTGNDRRNSARCLGIDKQIANNGTSGEDLLISAIRSTIKVVEAARVTTSVIPDHRHGSRMADNIERSNTTIADNNGEQRGAVFVRSGQLYLAARAPNVVEHKAVGKNPGLLNESNVPSEVGHIGPTNLDGSDVDRQNNRARAEAGGFPKENLPTVASLSTTSRAIEQDPSRGPNIALSSGNPPRTRANGGPILQTASAQSGHFHKESPLHARQNELHARGEAIQSLGRVRSVHNVKGMQPTANKQMNRHNRIDMKAKDNTGVATRFLHVIKGRVVSGLSRKPQFWCHEIVDVEFPIARTNKEAKSKVGATKRRG